MPMTPEEIDGSSKWLEQTLTNGAGRRAVSVWQKACASAGPNDPLRKFQRQVWQVCQFAGIKYSNNEAIDRLKQEAEKDNFFGLREQDVLDLIRDQIRLCEENRHPERRGVSPSGEPLEYRNPNVRHFGGQAHVHAHFYPQPHGGMSERDWQARDEQARPAQPSPSIARVELVCASAIEQRPIEWLWKPRLARGKIALIAGDPGVGKSAIGTDIVARITNAKAWPDDGIPPAGNCIILSAEDAADDTICPRLEIAGADMDRVKLLRMAGSERKTFSLNQDLPLLADAIKKLGNVILIVIDPITAYLGDKIDTHQTAAVRAVLEPVDDFAARHRVAILGITHPPKATQSKAINAFTGSLAFVAAARTAFVAIEEAETDRRLLLSVKTNIGPLAPGIAYRLGVAMTEKGIEAIRIDWDNTPVDMTANEAIHAAAEDARANNRQQEAENFLEAYLEAGPMPADKVYAAAEANGIAKRTLDRAKKRLRIVSEKDAFRSEWRWRLPQ